MIKLFKITRCIFTCSLCMFLIIFVRLSERFSLQFYGGCVNIPNKLQQPEFIVHADRRKNFDFAIFSYNFGNYRNELQVIEKHLVSFNIYGIDSYFFTDNIKFNNVSGWEIVHIEVPKKTTSFFDNPSRSAGKKIKFQFHEILEKYRYLIHSDARSDRLAQMQTWLSNGLLYYVVKNPRYALFIGEHPRRKTIEQEINFLIGRSEIQPQKELLKWKSFLDAEYGEINKVRLPQACTWILDTNHMDFVRKWSEIYKILIEHGLWRDQIVFSHAMAKEKDKIKYISIKTSKVPIFS